MDTKCVLGEGSAALLKQVCGVSPQKEIRMKVVTSTVKAAIGRIVHVYAPSLWIGPQPGIVSNGPFVEPVCENAPEGVRVVQTDGQVVNVNVLVDAAKNPEALKFWRSREQGNTLTSVPVYDALSGLEREIVEGRPCHPVGIVCWAEWPPRA